MVLVCEIGVWRGPAGSQLRHEHKQGWACTLGGLSPESMVAEQRPH